MWQAAARLGYQTIPLDISNPGHRAGLLKLWTDNMSDTRIAQVAESRLRWFYDENPIAPPKTYLSTYGQPAEVIGCGSTFTRRMWARANLVEAGIPCDFAVTKRHRIGGAALGIQQALIAGSRAGGQAFLFGFPNKLSLPILKRVGYQVVADAKAWVKPLRSLYKLKSHMKNPLAARAASAGAGRGPAGDGLGAHGARSGSPSAARSWTAPTNASTRSGTGRAASTGSSARSPPLFLNWRYAGFKSRRHQFYTLVHKRTGGLAGFVVFSVEDNKVFIVDLFAFDLETSLDPLLLGFSSAMRRAGHDSIFINYAGEPSFGRRLEKLWFRKSKHRERSLVVFADKDADPSLAAYLLDPANWLMFDGEMDI